MGSVVRSVTGMFTGGDSVPTPGAAPVADIKKQGDEAASIARQQREINEQQQGQVLPAQGRLTQALEQRATGQGPSLADVQMKSAQSRNLAQQLAAAAAMRGGNPAAAQRTVLQAGAQAGRDVAQQAQAARIQEQQQAQALLAQQLNAQQSMAAQNIQNLLKQGYDYSTAYELAKNQAAQQTWAARNQANMAQYQADQQMLGSLIGAGGSLAAAAITKSDKNSKENIKSGAKDVQKFLDALAAKSYNYKDASEPGAAPGKRVGIIAQDLEKSDMGKALVINSPSGKMVDTVQGFGAVLAAQSELNKRLKKLEKKS